MIKEMFNRTINNTVYVTGVVTKQQMMKIKVEILTLISILDVTILKFMGDSFRQFRVLLICLISVSVTVPFFTVADDGFPAFNCVVVLLFQFVICMWYTYTYI